MAENFEDYGEFEDISSTSYKRKKTFKVDVGEIAESYGEGIFKNIDKIIKGIGFVLAAIIILAFLTIGIFIAKISIKYLFVSFLVLLAGIIIGSIVLFLVYGIGHIISQNDEIINRLK